MIGFLTDCNNQNYFEKLANVCYLIVEYMFDTCLKTNQLFIDIIATNKFGYVIITILLK